MKAILCPYCKWNQITIANNTTKCQKCEKRINLSLDPKGYSRIKVLKNFTNSIEASNWIMNYRKKISQETNFFNYTKKLYN